MRKTGNWRDGEGDMGERSGGEAEGNRGVGRMVDVRDKVNARWVKGSEGGARV